MRGRWWQWENIKNIHLRLAFGCKEGGSGGRRVKRFEKSTSSSHLDAREVVAVGNMSKTSNSGLHLGAREEVVV